MSQSGVQVDDSVINVSYNKLEPAESSIVYSKQLQEVIGFNDGHHDSIINIGEASILSSVVNLCNSIVGAALLGLPYAAAQVGWILSIILLTIFAIVSSFTFQLLTTSGLIYNSATNTLTSSYSNLCSATVPKLQIFADFTIFLNTFGSMCAYLVIIGDLMPDAMGLFIHHKHNHIFNNLLLNRRFWITLFMLICIIPCCILKKLDFLRFTSSFAMICFVFITISMVVFFYNDSVNVCDSQLIDHNCGLDEFLDFKNPTDVFDFFKATPVYTFAFGTHPLAFSLTNELLKCNNKRMCIVIMLSFIITTIYYIAIGILGYWTFGNNVDSNVLNNYPQDSSLLFGVRIGLSFALAFSYPVCNTPCRQSLSGLVYKSNTEDISTKQFYIITFVIIICSFIIAMTVTDLGIVFGFIGSTSSPTVILILPGIFYYYINKKRYREGEPTCWDKLNQYGSIVSVICGILLVTLSLFVFFLDNH
eukprot:416673_1